ncbi:conserved hypothetical protein [Ricinus communis]|uniref:Uncharacterized protein n=1 Tax=Ricinus communis TaxID=3988 RepID=B9SVS4_RICCO|nr:conserved hypothetical protein [Ricinus communis]
MQKLNKGGIVRFGDVEVRPRATCYEIVICMEFKRHIILDKLTIVDRTCDTVLPTRGDDELEKTNHSCWQC